ncbi:MAG TPA: phage tail protein, partial [Puia sp.]|nr:phage tail protein [Puia sp.]
MPDAKADNFYQTVNFHFKVDFNFDSQDGVDVRFQSVTGLDSTLETETVKEGGENRFEHVIPVRRKYGPLTLKRGLLMPEDSKLTDWLKQAFDEEKVVPIDIVNITLLGDDHQALMHWTINNVWPRSWKVGELNAERGEVLIETL